MVEGVLVTPSLIKLSPLPAAQVVGNLSNKKRVVLARSGQIHEWH